MADLHSRLSENVPGAFYITSECIDCDMCRETAPSVFKRNDDIGFEAWFFNNPQLKPNGGDGRKSL